MASRRARPHSANRRLSIEFSRPRAFWFGCKVSIATPVTSPKGGQFVLHAKVLHGNPFDGHTLGPVITDMEKLTGARRIHVDIVSPQRDT